MGRLKGDTVAKGHPALAPLSLECLHPSKVAGVFVCPGSLQFRQTSLALKVEQPQAGKKSRSTGAFWRGLHDCQPPKRSRPAEHNMRTTLPL